MIYALMPVCPLCPAGMPGSAEIVGPGQRPVSAVAFSPEAGAREVFLIGGRAIRHVVYDPLLPSPFVDVQARHDFVETNGSSCLACVPAGILSSTGPSTVGT